MWNWIGVLQGNRAAASSVPCIATGPRSALQKHMKWHLSDKSLSQKRPWLSVCVSCHRPYQFVILCHKNVCHVVSHCVIWEHDYEILSGLLLHFNVSIVNIAGTASDDAACTYFMKYSTVLIIVSYPLKPLCTDLFIIHLQWINGYFFKKQICIFHLSFTLTYICGMDYVAIFYFCVLISM